MIRSSKIEEILKIDDTNLMYDIKRQAELLFWLGSELSDLEHLLEKETLTFDILSSKKSSRIRKENADNGIKLTEKAITEELLKSKKLKQKRLEIMDLKKALKVLQHAHKALVAKGSMLEQISFNRRKEIDFNIRKQELKKRVNKR